MTQHQIKAIDLKQIISYKFQHTTLDLIITQKDLYILDVLKSHAEAIQNITVLSNNGCSLQEMTSILPSLSQQKQNFSVQANHVQESIQSHCNIPLPPDKQPQPYRIIYQLLINNSYYVHLFASTLKKQLQSLERRYDVQFMVNCGVLSVKSCKKLSTFFKKQFVELQMKFRCFISKSLEIINKLKYSNLLQQNLRNSNIFFSIIIHNSKEGIIFYNTCKMDESTMANIIEQICQGHMAVVRVECRHNETNSRWNLLNLAPTALKQELQIIEKLYRASIEFSSKRQAFLIHSPHQCFSKQTCTLFKDALNSLLILTIQGIDKCRAASIIQEIQNANLDWLTLKLKDSNLFMAINTACVESERTNKIKTLLDSMINPKSTVTYMRSHYSKNKLRNNFKTELIHLADRYKLSVKQTHLSKEMNFNSSDLSILPNGEVKSQTFRTMIETLTTYLKQHHVPNTFNLLSCVNNLTNSRDPSPSQSKHQPPEMKLKISLP